MLSKFKNPAFVLRLLIGVAYVVLGSVILILGNNILFLSVYYRVGFCLLLIAYGIFRIYRAFGLDKLENS